MSALILRFPLAASVPPARPDRRAEIVVAARAVLRSAANHGDDILTEACVALQTWGDGTDWLEADCMLMTMRLRARRRAHEAAEADARKGTIRRELVGLAGFVVIVCAALAVYLAGGA
jgi:hypothetical protein